MCPEKLRCSRLMDKHVHTRTERPIHTSSEYGSTIRQTVTCMPLYSNAIHKQRNRAGVGLINTIETFTDFTIVHGSNRLRPDPQRQPEQRWTFQSRSQRRSRLRLEPRPQPLQSRAAAGQAPSSRSRQRSTPVRDPHGQQRVASGVALPLPSWPFPTLCTRVHVGRQRHGSRTFADRPGRARTLPKQLEGGGGS